MSEYSPPRIHSKPEIHLWWFSALLIAINVGLFLLQAINGMDLNQPSTQDAIHWGADYAPLTYLVEPIRLFTSMFFHFGFIHLMLNMWALYIFGSVAEQLYGRRYFIAMYLLAGLMGSLVSGYMSIQDSYALLEGGVANPQLLPAVSAGASGAVMGLGGALTVLSLFPVLPTQRFILDKKTLLLVMGINLMMGFMISGINNAAHIGGMIMGAVLSLVWYLSHKWHKTKTLQIIGIILGIGLCVLLYRYNLALIQPIQPLWQEILQLMEQQLSL
ncbi:rhomboid family intramembrane serine protease [Acinetobacter sp. NCu2D-2]|uniref:rhomboid family intramembrane serine protease n=1 Tax=Acinetobacter sp. NCu2D-2 TaxID=1608473 RepID=UPI0007CDC638|nr:rhomboid family intramembrane serine protease [Acinetobacter sp. NCu2D-2]ANF81328.1 rhomboid family intramembrane serine protease [Acinetobacter sp. NCu2D-2]